MHFKFKLVLFIEQIETIICYTHRFNSFFPSLSLFKNIEHSNTPHRCLIQTFIQSKVIHYPQKQ